MTDAPLRLRLDGDALAANWRWLAARQPGAACGAAVKADGYGLGARDVVVRLMAAGCRDFFVATWAEAEPLAWLLGGAGLSVLHGVRAEDMAEARASPARPVLNTPAQVARWRETGRPCDVMVDTGMNRLGLTPEQARSGLLDGLAIDTLHSHLACADEPDHPMNERQLAAFRALRQAVPARRYSLANSAGVLLGPKYGFGLTRPGLALYGGIPAAAAERDIRPVVRIEAQVLQVRDVPAGASVGYGATWVARSDTRVAILNLGYADGWLRPLAEETISRVGDQSFFAIGRISMDLIALDATNLSTMRHVEIKHGGEIVAAIKPLSPVPVREGDWLPLDFDLPRLAAASGLSQYELLTTLGRRYQRRWE